MAAPVEEQIAPKNECVKESVCSRSYGKEDKVKETQEGCLSRPIRTKSELF